MPSAANALSGALAQVGDRWSLLVVDALIDGPRRFAELQTAMPGIATNVLTQRLRHLEHNQVLLAVPYSRRPVRYSYELTRSGQDLAGAMRLLAQWNTDHHGSADSGGQPRVHMACGSPMAARWWCPTCDVPGDADLDSPVWV